MSEHETPHTNTARASREGANRNAPRRPAMRRLWALAALGCVLAAVVLAIVLSVEGFPRGLSVLACLALAALAAWYGIRRRGRARGAGFVLAVVLLSGAVALVILEGRPVADAIVVALIVLALRCAAFAFRVRVELPSAPRPHRPVLFYNPRSGGGKAERFHLVDEAAARGIEPVELGPGGDLETLVREAVAGGADALAMAGGDGSQAIVAAIAAELGLPYACIPAGTRNHFALDLGVDRDDVVGALDALVDGGERCVDLAEVNGRVFVNNVSLGLYAEAVQRPEYRDAKLRTLAAAVPDALGPQATPPELQWSGPAGRESGAAILVSNNAYRLGRALGSGMRPRLDGGVLGIAVIAPSAGGGDGRRGRPLSPHQWTAQTFQIEAPGPVPAGIDGEASMLGAPLRFSSRPGALRVRVARHHDGASPAAAVPSSPLQALAVLARFVLHPDPS